ncbi:MAG: TolC family protein [Prolixibacteraceae bacterium]|nr:TolC family protein [Prolixibacteraceae bacterium]
MSAIKIKISSKVDFLLYFLGVMLLSINIADAQVWSLEQCIDTAQVYNKNLKIGRNDISISQQKQQEIKANLIPKINLGADYKYFIDLPYQLMPQSAFGGAEGQFMETQFGVPHNINANIQLSMPLYNPQIYGAIKATKIATELSDLQLKKTEEQIFFEISSLYYNAQILQNQLAFVDSNLINTTKLLENMQLLQSQLMVTGNDVSKVRLQKEQLATQHELITSNLEQVLNALKFSMGIPFRQNIHVEPDIRYETSKAYSKLPSVDFQLARAKNHLLTSELTSLKNSWLPSVSLMASYGQTGFGYDEKPNDFLKFFPSSFAGIQISVPLFNGTVTKRKINQKNIEIQNSVLNMDLVAEQNDMQIENATRQRFVTQQTINNTSEQIRLAERVYQQTVLQQREGTATLTDVLMADNSLREAQQNYILAIIDYLKADLELKKITGNISFKN